MSAGPSNKYDAECIRVRAATKAKGAIVIIVDGSAGSGYSVKCSLDVVPRLPEILEAVAQELRHVQAAGDHL
jgi:hypothetical protein